MPRHGLASVRPSRPRRPRRRRAPSRRPHPDTVAIPDKATLAKLIDTTTGIAGIIVGGASTGPVLWGAFDDDRYDEACGDRWDDMDYGTTPPWAPAGSISVAWALAYTYGLEEAWAIPDQLGDAWDGSDVYVGWDEIAFGTGTVRAYDDGTLVLSCPAVDAPVGVTMTRHVAVPDAGAGGRFAVERISFTGVAPGGYGLADVRYVIDDGTDDWSGKPCETYGSTGPVAWATKDEHDTGNPAIVLIPLLSVHFEGDTDATGGDEYHLVGVAGATLAVGEQAVLAMVAGIRGGFSQDDAAGKDQAMLALGTERAALDGDAVCSVGTAGFDAR